MLEISILLAALLGIGLLGYLITIITPHVFHNIGLLMLVAGLVEGVPTGFWYHVVLRRVLIQHGPLPRRWWIHPTRHHAQLTPAPEGFGHRPGGATTAVNLIITPRFRMSSEAGVLKCSVKPSLDWTDSRYS